MTRTRNTHELATRAVETAGLKTKRGARARLQPFIDHVDISFVWTIEKVGDRFVPVAILGPSDEWMAIAFAEAKIVVTNVC